MNLWAKISIRKKIKILNMRFENWSFVWKTRGVTLLLLLKLYNTVIKQLFGRR